MNRSMGTERKTGEPFYRKHRNVFVGLFVMVPLVILPCFLVYTFLKADVLEKWEYLYVKYDDAGGLSRNGAVTILGMKVGYIESAAINDRGYIDVTMKIKRRYLHLVKKDSKARLQQKNIAIGDWEIELTAGTAGSPPAGRGDTLESVILTPLARTLDQVTRTVETLQQILQNIIDGKGTVGRLFKEDTLANLAKSVVGNANALIMRMQATMTRVDSVLVKAAVIGDRGKQVADSVVAISGKVGGLVTDMDLLVNGVRTASHDLPAMINRVQGDISEVELLLKTLQNNFLFKGGINSRPDPLLNDDPEK
jgi:phospholipid/cholesterol/gamma-HCH transport system substrate-binding protein